ncbi:MAG: hypothetical protein MI754_13020 [Chromatiales bacterium]|nr:hypothetical protein [Chromatiales bacterium]
MILISLAVLVAGYGLLIYPATQEDLLYSESMIKRRLDRIEKRTKLNVKNGGNPRSLAQQIKRVDETLNKLSAEVETVEAGFVPVDAIAEQQRLLLEVSTLARQAGVELLSVGRSTQVRRALADTQDQSAGGAPVDRRLQRPLMKISARSNYWQLLDFLDGLKGLTFDVAVMQISAHSQQLEDDGGEEDKALPPGALNISLLLAI